MEKLQPIEKKLEDLFKDLPHFPVSTKEMLANWLKYLVLIGGVFQLLAAWGLYTWGRDIDKIANVVNSYSSAFGVASSVQKLSIFYWISLIILLVDAVILLMAYKGVAAKQKDGWNLVFLSSLLNLVYGLFTLFNDRGGVSSLISALIGSFVSFYLLFEVRDMFKSAHVKSPAPAKK